MLKKERQQIQETQHQVGTNITVPAMDTIHHHQIIFNRVLHSDNIERSITFRKESEETFVTYQELFEFLEERTGIPKKYFIITHNKQHINYIDTFLVYYSSYSSKHTHFKPSKPFETIYTRMHLNIDYHIYNFYRRMLKSNFTDGTYLEFMKYTDELYSSSYKSSNPKTIETLYLCCKLLIEYDSNFKFLSPFKQFKLMTQYEVVSKRHKHLAKL